MTDEFDQAKILFEWSERFFAIVGAWPLRSSYVKFGVAILYFFIHMVFVFADFFYVFGNLELMVSNLTESTFNVMIFLKLMVMRFSRTLKHLTKRIIVSIDRSKFDSSEEAQIYLGYNHFAKKCFKIWVILGVSSAMLFGIKPVLYRLQSGLQNESMPYILSYRARYFFVVNDSTTFWLVWMYQAPVVYFSISQVIAIAYLLSLILHVSGQLSILTFRVHNLQLDTNKNEASSRDVFRDIATRHHDILGMIDDINGVFGLLLLEELLIMTLLLGLSAYTVMVNFSLEDPGALLAFLTYAAGLIVVIYAYCVAGESLMTESTNLFEAYFQCQWYNMSESFKKQMMICMLGASKPGQLKAGGFYNFSLEGFTSILKTSARYISLLRTMI